MALPSYNPLPTSPTGLVKGQTPGDPNNPTTYNAPKGPMWGDGSGAFYGLTAAQVDVAHGGTKPNTTPTSVTPTANMTLPPQNTTMDSYSWNTGGGSSSGGGGSAPPAPSSPSSPATSTAGDSSSLGAMRSLAGMSSPSSGMSVGGLGATSVGAGAGVGLDMSGAGNPIASTPPQAPGSSTDLPPNLAGGQSLNAPGADRQGLGQRVPPSLAAMLKPKVY